MKIDEVGIQTRDVVSLANFYRWLLRAPGACDDPVHQVVLAEGTGLTIGREEGALPPGGRVCLAFTVDDVDAEYRRLLSAGVTVLEPPTDRPWGARNLHFLDPDGNHLYFRSIPGA